MNLENLVIEIAKDLKDYEGCDGQDFVRWSKQDLKHYVLDGFAVLHSLYPRKFLKVQEIELQAGKIQELPEGITTLTRVLEVSTDDGAVASIASSTNERMEDLFSHECGKTGGDGYKLLGYEMVSGSDSVFYVTPPVPKGETVKAKVLAVKVPTELAEDTKLPAWVHSLLIEWAKYRAYSVDSESQVDLNVAQAHYQTFFALLSGIAQSEAILAQASGGTPIAVAQTT